MENHYHAVVWIDHREAHIFHFNAVDIDKLVLTSDSPTRKMHHKANAIGSGHEAENSAFLRAVADSVSDAGAILIAGPANEKLELIKFVHHHRPKMMDHIAGVETVDHPSDRALVAYARKYFKASDRMRPQTM
jgi:stalled ribosome rescue protein Dom34